MRERVESGKAFLLFDGLDEVVDTPTRLEAARRLQAMLDALHREGGGGCRCLITSRLYGYDRCRLRGVAHCQLDELSDGGIKQFIQKWTWAMERQLRPQAPREQDAVREAEELRRAIFEPGITQYGDTLQQFARNPLLLTILVLVMRRYGFNRPALFLAFILGGLFEQYFFLAVKTAGPLFFMRPLSLSLMVIILAVLSFDPMRRAWRRRRARKQS